MTERTPAEVFPPSVYIREELEERGWTQADLAEILGVDVSGIVQILNDRRGITADTARGLAEAFGTNAETWLRIDARYRLHSASSRPGTRLRAHIYAKAPVRELVKRGWIDGSSNPDVLAQDVCRFLGIVSLDDTPSPIPHAARKATSYAESSPGQIAWLCRVAQLAPAAPVVRPFSPPKLPELVVKLRTLARNLPDVRRVPALLAEYGIRFLVVEALPSSKMDGVTYWLDKNSPVIALSLRGGKLNGFWHTLLHELAHVKNRDGAVVDYDLSFEEGHLPPIEEAANRFAVETLVDPHHLASFINRVGPAYSLTRIIGFAEKMEVHPAIIIGQLAYRKEISWARFGRQLPSIRELVASTALTDGWGTALPSLIRKD
ncbi:MAG: HigA family addiction module antitoxin [Dehalococcoidia bacterium]|nr:HigA family addiction module antidote protein [Dehalococcoidia bacterium]